MTTEITKIEFKGTKSAKQIREEGKAQKLEGKALREYIQANLTGDTLNAHKIALKGMIDLDEVQVRIDQQTKGGLIKATLGLKHNFTQIKDSRKRADILAELETLKAEKAKAEAEKAKKSLEAVTA